jgi:hypothetical protein
VLAGGAAVGLGAAGRVEPELVLHNGLITTVDPRQPRAQAVAIAGGRLMAVGSDAEILGMAGARTRKVDLGRRRVTPGFNDAHAHPADSGVNHLTMVAADKTDIEEIKRDVRAWAAKVPRGQWVLGFLYDDGKGPRPLNRDDLDQAVPDRPVMIRHRGGHTVFVNSKALQLAGVTESTPDPKGGYFERKNGRMTGRIGDLASAKFEELAAYSPTREDWRKGSALISRMFAAKGVTSCCDASGGPDSLRGYQDARDAGELGVRIYCHIYSGQLDKVMESGVHTGFGDEQLRLGAVKLFADGSISERTAWLKQPYLDMPGNFTGLQVQTAEELYGYASKAHAAGWQIGVHGNGDRALEGVLDLFERLQRENPRRDPRFRIEHCTMVTPQIVRRIKAVGAIPVTFGGYVYFHSGVLHYYGEERLKRMFAMRSFLDAGVPATSSSDYTASPSNPMMWLQSQVTRRGMDGKVWGGNQRITLDEAIRCATLNGAHASREETIKGSLEAGKLADLVVWGQDFTKADPTQLIEVPVERTMVGGRWIHEA